MSVFQMHGTVVQAPNLVSVNSTNYYRISLEETKESSFNQAFTHDIYLRADLKQDNLLNALVSIKGYILNLNGSEYLIGNSLSVICSYDMEEKEKD